MLALALLLLAQLGTPTADQALPRHASEQDCYAGWILFFEHGKDRLHPESMNELQSWIRNLGQIEEDGHVEIEASAGGSGPTFDHQQSLRRMLELKRILMANGVAASIIEMTQTSFQNAPPAPDAETKAEWARYGHVRFMVREASEFASPGFYRHCW